MRYAKLLDVSVHGSQKRWNLQYLSLALAQLVPLLSSTSFRTLTYRHFQNRKSVIAGSKIPSPRTRRVICRLVGAAAIVSLDLEFVVSFLCAGLEAALS